MCGDDIAGLTIDDKGQYVIKKPVAEPSGSAHANISPAQQTSPDANMPPEKIAAALKKFFEQIEQSESANILAGPSANREATSGTSDKPELP